MGIFDDITNLSPTGMQINSMDWDTSTEDYFNPAGFLSEQATAEGEEGISMLLDPLDLFGHRAEATAGKVSDIVLDSTREGIAQNEAMRQRIEGLQQPFRDQALNVGLPALRAMAGLGGDINYTPSKLFGQQAETGTRAIRRRQAGRGMLDSSNTYEGVGDLLKNLAAEDVARFERGNLSAVQTGIGSTNALQAAGGVLSGNVAGLLENAGANLNANNQALADQRRASFSSGANAGYGVSQYLNQG